MLAKIKNYCRQDPYMHVNKCYLRHLYQWKKSYINMQLESNNNSQVLFRILQQLTKRQHDNPIPACSSHEELANKFADFFINKIEMMRSQFQQSNLYTPPSWNCNNLTQFRPIRNEETLKILNSMKKTTCDVDPCHINFLMEFQRNLAKNMHKDNQQITIKWLLSPVLANSCYQTTYQIFQIAQKIQKLLTHK